MSTQSGPPVGQFTIEQVTTLYRLGKLVRASLDLDATLAAIADAARELTAAEVSTISLLDSDQQLVLHVGETVHAARGIAGRALSELETVLISDMRAESDRARADLDASSRVGAYIASPLVWNGQRLGVVTVAATTPHALGPADAVLVEELAGQAAAAVAHARAYACEQEQHAATDRINSQLAERTEQLEGLQQRLVQREKLTAIGQLAEGIAHEMNTPLAVIVSNLSVLQEYGTALATFSTVAQDAVGRLQQLEAPGAVAESLRAAAQSANLSYVLEDLPLLTSESTTSADRIAAIVRSVATFARQGLGSPEAVSVDEALEAAINLSWNELKQRGQLVRQFSDVPPVMGQLSELAQLFVHLLLNAAQSLPDRQGVVTVTTESDSREVSVRISDNGCGIAREFLSRVFDPFFSTRGPGLGTGMGLSACHGIVTRFGGTIGLESEVGLGTTVTVRLPLATSHTQEAA